MLFIMNSVNSKLLIIFYTFYLVQNLTIFNKIYLHEKLFLYIKRIKTTKWELTKVLATLQSMYKHFDGLSQ